MVRNKKSHNKLKRWKLLSRKRVFKALPWVEVFEDKIRLPGDMIIDDFYSIKLPEFVVIYARNGNKVLCQKQYQYSVGKIQLNLPAGCCEKGESVLQTAKREFLEETGYKAKRWIHIGSFFVDSRRGCGKAHFYLADQLIKITDPVYDATEDCNIVFIPEPSLLKAVSCGKINSLAAVCLISMVNFKLPNHR